MKLRSRTYFLLATAIFLIVFIINQSDGSEKKSIRAIPKHYVSINNLAFVYVADTLYFHNRKFSGYQFALYPNGDTVMTKSYLEGLEEGWTRKWYTRNQLAEERYFEKGKKERIHKAWWPNGKQKFIYEFQNDEFNGTNKEWFEEGALFKIFHYEKGYEVGSQKMFWPNGKIRANYIVKNNRRYGLLGTKNCVNVADSVFIQP